MPNNLFKVQVMVHADWIDRVNVPLKNTELYQTYDEISEWPVK